MDFRPSRMIDGRNSSCSLTPLANRVSPFGRPAFQVAGSLISAILATFILLGIFCALFFPRAWVNTDVLVGNTYRAVDRMCARCTFHATLTYGELI